MRYEILRQCRGDPRGRPPLSCAFRFVSGDCEGRPYILLDVADFFDGKTGNF